MLETWSARPETGPATGAAGSDALCTGGALVERVGAMVPGAPLAEAVERLLAAVPPPPARTGQGAVTGEGTEPTSGSFASVGHAGPVGAEDWRRGRWERPAQLLRRRRRPGRGGAAACRWCARGPGVGRVRPSRRRRPSSPSRARSRAAWGCLAPGPGGWWSVARAWPARSRHRSRACTGWGRPMGPRPPQHPTRQHVGVRPGRYRRWGHVCRRARPRPGRRRARPGACGRIPCVPETPRAPAPDVRSPPGAATWTMSPPGLRAGRRARTT